MAPEFCGKHFQKRIQILFLNRIGWMSQGQLCNCSWMSIENVIFCIGFTRKFFLTNFQKLGWEKQIAPEIWDNYSIIQFFFLNRIIWMSLGHVIFCMGFVSKSFLPKVVKEFGGKYRWLKNFEVGNYFRKRV